MKILAIMLAVSAIVSVSSCNDDASSRVKKENVEASKEKAETKGKIAVIEFEKDKHDFGALVQGDVVETRFKFKNVGEGPLVITNAKATCGCTVPEYPDQPIKPGEEGEILVKFNSTGKLGKQDKVVRLTTNTEKGTEILHILAVVSKKKN